MSFEQNDAPKEFAGRLAKGKDWREIVAWVGDLPPMPHVAQRAIKMVEDPNTSAAELTDLLSSDTALAARVMKIANSAMFSRQRQITTLNQAIMIIGFKALKGIVVAAALRQVNKNFGKVEQLIWEHSMACATCATRVARKLKKRYSDEIFLLGLLHSLGQIVLLVQEETQREYFKVLAKIKESNVDFVTAEQEVLGFSHPLIGALVAKKWNFSADTCQVILHYKDPVDIDNMQSTAEEKTIIVQLSDLITHAAGIGSPEGYPDERGKMMALAVYAGFDPKTADEDLDALIAETKEQFEKEKGIYG